MLRDQTEPLPRQPPSVNDSSNGAAGYGLASRLGVTSSLLIFVLVRFLDGDFAAGRKRFRVETGRGAAFVMVFLNPVFLRRLAFAGLAAMSSFISHTSPIDAARVNG